MKWAPGPLLFLGACRITYVLGANHRESPCGSAGGMFPQAHNPPRKAGTGATAVVRQALRSHTDQRRIHDGSTTHPRRISDASATAPRRLRDASVPENPEIRLANLATYNQRTTNNQRPNLPPANPPIPSLDYRKVRMTVSRLALDPRSLRKRAGVERRTGERALDDAITLSFVDRSPIRRGGGRSGHQCRPAPPTCFRTYSRRCPAPEPVLTPSPSPLAEKRGACRTP